jgi:hypothetical protein
MAFGPLTDTVCIDAVCTPHESVITARNEWMRSTHLAQVTVSPTGTVTHSHNPFAVSSDDDAADFTSPLLQYHPAERGYYTVVLPATLHPVPSLWTPFAMYPIQRTVRSRPMATHFRLAQLADRLYEHLLLPSHSLDTYIQLSRTGERLFQHAMRAHMPVERSTEKTPPVEKDPNDLLKVLGDKMAAWQAQVKTLQAENEALKKEMAELKARNTALAEYAKAAHSMVGGQL